MLCYPNKIKELPQYAEFVEAYRKYRNTKCSRRERYYIRKKLIADYEIQPTPADCNSRCPYYEDCQLDNKK